MSSIAEATSQSRRSRNGCERCRRRRQKCDETQPSCGRCRNAGEGCSYRVNLRWGGRSFTRSRFGDCEVKKLDAPTGGFVYSSQNSVLPLTGLNKLRETQSLDTLLRTALNPLSELDLQQRNLLDYFIHVASSVMSSHAKPQAEACRALVPMAVEVPSLLNAILAISWSHRSLAKGQHSQNAGHEAQAMQLKMKSIHCLRYEIESTRGMHPAAVLATSLMLCQCVLSHNLGDYNSWRVFLEGAKVALAGVCGADSSADDTTTRYLRDRYALFEMIAMLTPRGFPARDLVADSDSRHADISEIYLDDKIGCSTDTLRLFRTISALAWERTQLQTLSNGDSMLTLQDLENEASNLEDELLEIIKRDEQQPPDFYPGVREMLSQEQMNEFSACNQIFGYTALIHLRKEVKQLDSRSSSIQDPIRKIVSLAAAIEPPRGLSPGLGLNTALFIAGCEAQPEERPAILNLLSALHESTGNYNMVHAKRELEACWSRSDAEVEMGVLCGAEMRGEDDGGVRDRLDFVTY